MRGERGGGRGGEQVGEIHLGCHGGEALVAPGGLIVFGGAAMLSYMCSFSAGRMLNSEAPTPTLYDTKRARGGWRTRGRAFLFSQRDFA